jgi:hypothetical protein
VHISEGRSRNHCWRVKTTNITCYECVFVALVIQHEMRMRRITRILSAVACLAVPYFPTLSHTSHEVWGKKLLNIKCVF